MTANCREEIFDPRRYDGTGVSLEHADGLIEELGRLCRAQSTSWAQPPVESKSLADPPEPPHDGLRYLIPSGATDYWEGLDDYIAEYSEAILMWRVLAPREGMLTWVKDEGEYYTYDGVVWKLLQDDAGTHPTLPTVDEKAALVGTSGVASDTNRYVTDADPRLAGVVGGGPQMVTFYLVNPVGALDEDPTVEAVDSDGDADDDTQWIVMHKSTFYIPASTAARSLGAILRWNARVTSGTGGTKWAISTDAEFVGSPPSVGAIDLLTSPKPVTTSEQNQDVSGLIPGAALPTGTFFILLLGKPDQAGETVTAKILTESSLELVY